MAVVSRRTLCAASVVAVAAFAVAGCSSQPESSGGEGDGLSGELVFSIYPGVFSDLYIEAVVDPFLAEHPDLQIDYVDARTSAESLAALRAESSNPTVDVALLDLAVASTANEEGIFAPLDPEIVTNMEQLLPGAQIEGGMGVGVTFDSVALMANTDLVDEVPTSWNALWDDPAGDGAIAIIGPPDLTSTVGLTVITTQMEGGDYTQSVDEGIERLAELAPRVLTWNPQPDPYTMVQSGAAAYGVGWNARSQLFAADSGGSMVAVMPEEGSVFQVNTLNLVEGAPNPEAAQEFINYAISVEAQSAFAELMAYAPTNSEVSLSDELLDVIPAADPEQADRVIQLDWDVVREQRDTWAERLQREVVGG